MPRRIRAVLTGHVVHDTTKALNVWEWPNYPQYNIPIAGVTPDVLVDEDHPQRLPGGPPGRTVSGPAISLGRARPGSTVQTLSMFWPGQSASSGDALDAWFEEDEEVFVHPRNPYTRVDALRSTRRVRIELDGAVLAESSLPVMVFETGLPTRYYLNSTETVTSCPYRGRTSGYWSVRVGDTTQRDLAWTYDFPTRQLLPIAGLIAFYNEKVDIIVDGQRLARPITYFFR